MMMSHLLTSIIEAQRQRERHQRLHQIQPQDHASLQSSRMRSAKAQALRQFMQNKRATILENLKEMSGVLERMNKQRDSCKACDGHVFGEVQELIDTWEEVSVAVDKVVSEIEMKMRVLGVERVCEKEVDEGEGGEKMGSEEVGRSEKEDLEELLGAKDERHLP